MVHSRALVLFPPCSPRLWARKLKVGRVVSVNFARLAHAGWQRRAGERNGPFPRSCSPGPRESVCGAVYHVSRPSRKLPPFPRRRVGVRFFVAFAEPAAGREEALRFGSRGCFCNERAQKKPRRVCLPVLMPVSLHRCDPLSKVRWQPLPSQGCSKPRERKENTSSPPGHGELRPSTAKASHPFPALPPPLPPSRRGTPGGGGERSESRGDGRCWSRKTCVHHKATAIEDGTEDSGLFTPCKKERGKKKLQ